MILNIVGRLVGTMPAVNKNVPNHQFYLVIEESTAIDQTGKPLFTPNIFKIFVNDHKAFSQLGSFQNGKVKCRCYLNGRRYKTLKGDYNYNLNLVLKSISLYDQE